MKTLDVEDVVIADLKKNATTILKVLDRDTQEALLEGDKSLISAINVNMRTLTAINEVLLYYGDSGVFDEDGAL
jgi:sporulation protein YlmC with PRC-barrel domain